MLLNDYHLLMIDMLLGVKFNAQIKPCFKKYLEGKVQRIKAAASSEVAALIAISSGEAAEFEQQIDTRKLCSSMLKFKQLHALILAIKVATGDADQIRLIITHLIAPTKRTFNRFETLTIKLAFAVLSKGAEETYVDVLGTFFQTRDSSPPLSDILDFTSFHHFTKLSTMHKATLVLIKHANLSNKASVDLLQYFIFSRFGGSDKARFCVLSLYTELCLRMLDNKFFDVLKDLIEEEVANHAHSVGQLNLVLGLVRKTARCQKTDYSLKFIDLIQGVLGLLNKPVADLGSDE